MPSKSGPADVKKKQMKNGGRVCNQFNPAFHDRCETHLEASRWPLPTANHEPRPPAAQTTKTAKTTKTRPVNESNNTAIRLPIRTYPVVFFVSVCVCVCVRVKLSKKRESWTKERKGRVYRQRDTERETTYDILVDLLIWPIISSI